MSNCRVLCMLAIVTALMSVTLVYGGPARALGSMINSRTVKIPRAIRAPFRNNEMMTARGFGKRSQQMFKLKDGIWWLLFFVFYQPTAFCLKPFNISFCVRQLPKAWHRSPMAHRQCTRWYQPSWQFGYNTKTFEYTIWWKVNRNIRILSWFNS